MGEEEEGKKAQDDSEIETQRRRNVELRAENSKLKRALLYFLKTYYPMPQDGEKSLDVKSLKGTVQVCHKDRSQMQL